MELTERGRRELRTGAPSFKRAIDSVRDELGDDVEVVLWALDRLVAALRTVVPSYGGADVRRLEP